MKRNQHSLYFRSRRHQFRKKKKPVVDQSQQINQWLSEVGGPIVTWITKKKPRSSKLVLQLDIENMNASKFLEQGEFNKVWTHLERAHILSQRFALRHFLVHLVMLGIAITQRDFREFFGQIPRLLFAIPSSWLNLAPLGNTGRSNLGFFQKMPLPKDLEWISIKSDSAQVQGLS